MIAQTQTPKLTGFIDWTRAPDEFDAKRFDGLASFMLVALVSHCGMLVARDVEIGHMAATVFMPAYVLCAIVGLTSRAAKPACLVIALAVTTWWLAIAWPTFANHLLLEWSVLLFLVICRKDPVLGMQAARWLLAIVLFHTGFQKFVIGQYFTGAFLAFNTATIQNFTEFMGLVLSDQEFARIVALEGKLGSGPYAVRDTQFVVMSNLVWIAEMGLAPLLVIEKTRKFAVVAAFALIVSIELGAREVIFGCLFTALLIGSYPRKNLIAWWPGLAAFQLAAMLAFHLFPDWRLN